MPIYCQATILLNFITTVTHYNSCDGWIRKVTVCDEVLANVMWMGKEHRHLIAHVGVRYVRL